MTGESSRTLGTSDTPVYGSSNQTLLNRKDLRGGVDEFHILVILPAVLLFKPKTGIGNVEEDKELYCYYTLVMLTSSYKPVIEENVVSCDTLQYFTVFFTGSFRQFVNTFISSCDIV